MKKIYILLLITLTSFLVGCTVTNTTTELEVTTQSTETTETTTIDYEVALQDEMEYLASFIPTEITDDLTLESPRSLSIEVSYFQDETLLDDNIFVYTATLEGINSTLTISLTYGDFVLEENFTVLLVENESEYYQDQIDLTFSEIFLMIDSIPSVVESDFTLPVVDMDGVYVEYNVDQSYIYNGRFVFPFNEEESFLTVNATVRYEGITRYKEVEVKLLSFDDLQQIPRIYIETTSGEEVTEKDEYVEANFSLYSFTETNEVIRLVTNERIEIRCRGNSTFYMPKYSYKLEFDNKTPLLFDYSEKDWVLLANFADQTLIRDYLAKDLSRNMDMEFTPSAAFADVYLNGEYIGNYQISDHIKVTNDRVDIEEHSTNIDTGYLIEFDKRLLESWMEDVEGVDYFVSYGIPFELKSPKPDEISEAQFDFIKDYIDETFYVLNNGLDYSSYIDIDSFVDWFIINELFQNVDSGYSSVYLYKDAGGLLKMGPVWDFDLSSGNPGHLGDDLRKPEGWYTILQYKNLFYYYLINYESFQVALKNRWNEVYDVQIKDMIDSIYPVADSISKSRYMNFERWDVIGVNYEWYTAPEVYEADTYQKQLEFLYYFLSTRAEWLNTQINYF